MLPSARLLHSNRPPFGLGHQVIFGHEFGELLRQHNVSRNIKNEEIKNRETNEIEIRTNILPVLVVIVKVLIGVVDLLGELLNIDDTFRVILFNTIYKNRIHLKTSNYFVIIYLPIL